MQPQLWDATIFCEILHKLVTKRCLGQKNKARSGYRQTDGGAKSSKEAILVSMLNRSQGMIDSKTPAA